ncbi:MAG: hypothetical protein Q9201_001122 [Fulgogasparrea decipioides]
MSSLANPGLKRKAAPAQSGSIKKARYTEDYLVHDSEADSSGPQSSADSSNGSENESEQLAKADTPLTPISPRAPTRFPSELKTHLCTYSDCAKAFNRPAKLAEHLLSHTNLRPFVCPHQPCTKDFLRQSHLKHHIKSVHSNVRDYICEWEGCGKSFITATRLKRHYATHEGGEKFKCSVCDCGQTFRKHATLQKHILTVHEGRKPYSCELRDEDDNVCGQGFETAGKLRAHEGRVHGGKRFWCSICANDNYREDEAPQEASNGDEAGFSTYAQLQEHIKIDHPPKCNTCGLACSSQRELKNHVELQHVMPNIDERKTHLCPEPNCGRAFTKKWNLHVHIQSTHQSKKYVCGEVKLGILNMVEGWDGLNACGRALSTKGSLESHIRTAHMGMGRRRSKARKRQTSDPTEQNLIKLTGAGYKEDSGRHIECLLPDCEFRFKRAYDLQTHLLSHHSLPESDAERLIDTAGRNGDFLSAHYTGFPDDLMQDIHPRDWHMLDTQGYRNISEEDVKDGGHYWMGDDQADADEQGEDGWFHEQMEMRMLIDGDDAEVQGQDEAAAVIDPFLQ